MPKEGPLKGYLTYIGAILVGIGGILYGTNLITLEVFIVIESIASSVFGVGIRRAIKKP